MAMTTAVAEPSSPPAQSEVIRIEITADDLWHGDVRSLSNNPIARAYSRAFGYEILVGQGRFFTEAADVRMKEGADCRDYFLYWPYLNGQEWDTRYERLHERLQSLCRWLSYGPSTSPERYRQIVRPISFNLIERIN
jgi:hypothetical protein